LLNRQDAGLAKKSDWNEATGCCRMEVNSPARLWRDTSRKSLTLLKMRLFWIIYISSYHCDNIKRNILIIDILTIILLVYILIIRCIFLANLWGNKFVFLNCAWLLETR